MTWVPFMNPCRKIAGGVWYFLVLALIVGGLVPMVGWGAPEEQTSVQEPTAVRSASLFDISGNTGKGEVSAKIKFKTRSEGEAFPIRRQDDGGKLVNADEKKSLVSTRVGQN